MKRYEIEKIPFDLPDEIQKLISGARIYDSSCSNAARVYYIDKNCGYYLKRAKKGALSREAKMCRLFAEKSLTSDLIDYISNDFDYMVTERVKGEDCTLAKYLDDPERLCDTLGEILYSLHSESFDINICEDYTKKYLSLAKKNYESGADNKSAFPDSFGYKSEEEAWSVLCEGAKDLRSDTLIHGDFCLPNIMLDDWSFSGFIDLGNSGASDRHIDLFWGAWSLWFNLKTDKYTDRFFDAYGRERIDKHLLRTVAAAEVFG